MSDNPYLDFAEGETKQPAPANPYMGLLESADAMREQQQRATTTRALGINPDKYAQQKRVADYLGYPPVAVEAMPVQTEQEAKLKRVQQDIAASPVLKTRFTDADFAKLAHDDTDSLSKIQDLFTNSAKYITSAPGTKNNLMGDIGAGLHRANRGAAGVFQASADIPAPLLDFLEPVESIGGNPLRRLSEGFAMRGAASEQIAKNLSPAQEGNVAGGISSGVQSLVQNTLALPLAFLPGGQPAAMSMMAGGAGGQAYQQAKEQGMSTAQALPFATSQAVVEYVTEKIPLTKLIGDVRAATPLLQTLARQAALEIPGEQVATLLQDMNEWAVLPQNKDKPFSAYLAERPDAAAQTLIATLVGVGGNVAVMRALGSPDQTQAAQQDAERIQTLFTMATEGKLHERSPGTFAGMVQEMADGSPDAPKVARFDARLLIDTLEQGGLDAATVQQMFPSVGEQLQEALAVGGEVTIPLGEFTSVIGTDIEQTLLENARFGENEFSQAEAKATSEQATKLLAEESQRVIAAASDVAAAQAGADAVKTQVLEQLTTANRFRADVNEAYSTLVRDFYTTTAGRLGITPDELYTRYPLRIQARNPATQAEVLNAGADARTEAAAAALELGKDAGLYQNPKSAATDFAAMAQEKAPGLRVERESITQQDGSENPTGNWNIVTPQGDDVIVTERDGKVWLNVAGMKPGSGGAAVYDLVANYALNNGLKFAGDPSGLSDAAMVRRTENMLSSAIKYGTTDHLEPHPKQLVGNDTIPGLVWKDGDTLGNIQSMIEATVAANAKLSPAGTGVEYDATAGQVVDSEGFALGAEDLRALSNLDRGAGGAGAPGHSTLQRAALFRALLSGPDGQREVLESLRRVQGDGGPLAGSFYQEPVTPEQAAATNVSVELPTDPIFAEAVANTPGADITPEGLRIDLVRYQRPEQQGARAVRTGVFYLPKGSPALNPYEAGDSGFGGSQIVEGETLLRRPLFIKGSTGGKVAQNAYDQLMGKGSYAKLRDDVLSAVAGWDKTADQRLTNVAELLATYGADPALAPAIVAHSKAGNQLPYAITENVVAHEVRAAGYDSVLGHSKGKQGPFLSEVFDVREQTFPAHGQESEIHPDFQQSADQTQTTEFKKWFGDSKVVDADGKPLVVYHGSPDMRFLNEDGIFATLKDRMLKFGATPESKKRANEERAFFFTSSQSVAKTYANPKRAFDYQNAEEGVVTTYLSIQNPLVFDANGTHWREAQKAISKEDFIKAAKEAGHDGVIIKNVRDSYDSLDTGKDPKSDVFVAFKSTQIKSAIGNRGTFDPNNPSILEQGPRGTFNPNSLTISLLEKADLSTFLHETGHFFLTALADIASQPNAPAGMVKDMAALLDWFGVKDLETWNSMTLDQQRKHHERFAESFEQYLLEGKAPSADLQPLFQRFRSWLTNVYRSLSEFMAGRNLQLSDDVRAVFDRLLASEQQIQQMETMRGYAPVFESAEQAGMTPEEWTAYQMQGQKATATALDDLASRSVRDMRWTTNARSRALKALQKDAAEKRKAVEKEVAAEVAQQTVYRVQRWLRKGEMTTPDGEEIKAEKGFRLNTAALAEMYPESALDHPDLTKLKGMTAANGLHPDVVADMFGYSGGDQLVRDVIDAEPMASVIEGMTDQRMLERFGDLATPAGVQRAADEAVHNEARGRFVATELKALQKANGETERTAAGGSVNVMNRAAKQFAAQIVARRKVRDLKPGQHTAAESRAARAAQKALRGGDTQAAIVAKRDELLNHHAARETYSAIDEVEKALTYLKRFDKDSTRKKLPPEYLDQIDKLLERIDLRQATNKALDKRAKLADWIKSQADIGIEVNLPADVLEDAQLTNYRELTLEQFRGLVDTVKQVEHLARLKDKLLTAKDQREFTAIKESIAASIIENAGDRKADTRTPTTNLGRALQGMRNFGAAHIKAATWARILDGGKDGGPMWEFFVRSANERGDMETAMRAKATKDLTAIMSPLMKQGKLGGKGKYFASVDRTLNREAVLTIALNTGNAGNLQRLLGGEGWTAAQLKPVLDTLSKDDWAAVQKVWDYMDSFRPLIAAKERRVFGKEPDWVEAGSPVTDAYGVKGGYYPIKYDPAASVRAEEHADAEGAKRQLQGAYGAATTKRSFTKARAEEVSGRPLLYNLSGVYSGVNDVIHDLAWHEWLIDTNRLLKSQTIDSAIRTKYGPAAVRQLKSWRDAVAEGDSGPQEAIDMALGKLRQNVSVAGLGFNVVSALMQPLGITQSITRVGAGWIGKGVMQYTAAPIETTREVNEKSTFMANRSRTRFRELNELRNKVQGQTGVKRAISENAFVMMMRVQQMVDVPTWLGAYEKAIADGQDEARSIALADQAVIDSQGGGQTKDLAAIERGGPAQKLFTVFYSFMNTALNLGVTSKMTPKSKAKFAVDMAMLFVVPAVLGKLLKDALIPGDEGDDDEEIAKKLAAEQLTFLLGTVVLGREFGSAVQMATGASGSRDYTGPAGLRAIADVYQFTKQAGQGEFDDAFRKASINLVGDMFGLPSAQINRTIIGAQALKEGKTKNPAALALGFQEAR